MTAPHRRRAPLAALCACALALCLALAAPAEAAPHWRIDALTDPTWVPKPDDPATSIVPENLTVYYVRIQNDGDAPAPETPAGDATNCEPGGPAPENCYVLRASFPPGIEPLFAAEPSVGSSCSVDSLAREVLCKVPGEVDEGGKCCSPQIRPLNNRIAEIYAEVTAPLGSQLTASFEVSGAGAGTATTTRSLKVAAANPPFDFAAFDARIGAGAAGNHFAQAGGHPEDVSTSFELESIAHPNVAEVGTLWPVEAPRQILADLPPGLLGVPTAAPRCTISELSVNEGTGGSPSPAPLCPAGSQVGETYVRTPNGRKSMLGPVPIFNMSPPVGVPARFGFNFLGTAVVLDAHLRSESDYGVTVGVRRVPQALAIQGSEVTIWGLPAGAAHDHERACPGELAPGNPEGGETCPSPAAELPFLRNPTACTPPGEGLPFALRTDSWQDPGDVRSASIRTHEAPAYPALPSQWGAERGIEGCEKVPLKGELAAKPTTPQTESASGLQVRLQVPNPGFDNPEGIASSDLKKVRVSLPAGITINPSQAEGLGTCSPAQYESTELSFFPTDKGCPDDSKIGTVEVKTPLLDEKVPGSVYVAEQDNNPFGSLLAIYVVLEEPERGVLVKMAGRVDTDGTSGRIVTTFDDLPQLPFDTFDFKFREGARAPLVTPPTCGTYTTTTEIWGHSNPDGPPLVSKSSFAIDRGIGGGPCPSGAPGFDPSFSAGTVNPTAGAFSPTLMRLTRKDGEQDLTKFSAVLPEGLLAKLAGVSKCSDAAIAAASGKSGKEELASPSCPANSKIGRTEAGAGVGSVLTYVPGSLYLGGPYHGAPLSVVSITPAVAGPFDVGTVVVRVALDLDPVTGVASVDGSASDPIPHILEGIPLKLRDLRVYVDRSQFTLNPTSCDPMQLGATLWGSATDVFSAADDQPVNRSSRFQAASCASLGFKPRLGLKLKGGTRRGSFPGLQATYRPREADANAAGLIVRLPRSAFLEQGHIRTVCTRVQFAADSCPKGSVYGHIKGWTPLLEEPLEGPVYLRSSSHKLPDLVFDLHGLVDIEVATRIDSVKGGIRAQVQEIPDAPISKVVLSMQGGKKGLIVNSRNLCFEPGRNRANVGFSGQNGKRFVARPVLRASGCGKQRHKKHKRHSRP